MNKEQLFIKMDREHDYRMKVYVPWQRKDWINKIRELPDRAWNKEGKYWSVPKDEATVINLKQLFGDRLKISDAIEFNPIKRLNKSCSTPNHSIDTNLFEVPNDKYFKEIRKGGRVFKVFVGNKVIIQKATEHWLCIWIPYEKYGWIDIVKSIIGRKWLSEKKCWMVPYVKDTLECLSQIEDCYLSYTFEVSKYVPSHFEVPILPEKRRNKRKELTKMQKKAVTALEERLLIERCSWRTIKSYRSHLVNLLLAYPNEKPSNLNAKQIQAYMLKEIKTKNISESTQNQLVNALKAFYERVCKQSQTGKEY